jgi:hypothetical protein
MPPRQTLEEDRVGDQSQGAYLDLSTLPSHITGQNELFPARG